MKSTITLIKVMSFIMLILVIGGIGLFRTEIYGRTVIDIITANISKDNLIASSKTEGNKTQDDDEDEDETKVSKNITESKSNGTDANSTATTAVAQKPAVNAGNVNITSSNTVGTIKDITKSNTNGLDVVSTATTAVEQKPAVNAGNVNITSSNTVGTIKDITKSNTNGLDVVSTATTTVAQKPTTNTGSVKTTNNNSSTANINNYIGEAKAKLIALQRVPGATIKKFNLEYDDGKAKYTGKMYLGKNEYEFKIDAVTGAILKWETDD